MGKRPARICGLRAGRLHAAVRTRDMGVCPVVAERSSTQKALRPRIVKRFLRTLIIKRYGTVYISQEFWTSFTEALQVTKRSINNHAV
jgi:hypothetical protein